MDIHGPDTLYSLVGSAPVPLTLDGLISLSTDPVTTAQNLRSINNIPLGLPKDNELRETVVSALFSGINGVNAEHVVTTAGSTAGNAVVMQSLLQPGDHVIVQYPTFAQLLGLPKALPGVDVSLWKMDPSKGWDADIDELRGLIREGKTKMIILNNPHNPTGYSLPTKLRRGIVDLAKENKIWIHADEIFRPLFHDPHSDASSFMDYSEEYPKIVVTGSTSKAWALAGLRVGWIVTKDKSALGRFHNMTGYVFGDCGALDVAIATESLSSRCRDNILQRQSHQAQKNLSLLEQFILRYAKNVTWTKPTSGATAFVQFRKDNNSPVDDVDFCEKLRAAKKVLLAPRSLCFGDGPQGNGEQGGNDIKGFVRWHLTGSTDILLKGMAEIIDFLKEGFDAVKTAH